MMLPSCFLRVPLCRLVALGCLFGATFICSPAVAQPSVASCSPSALAPGKAVELTLNGAKLDDPLNVWTSFKATVEVLPPKDPKAKTHAQRTLKITPDAAEKVGGIGGVVVATKEGASDPVLVLFDDLPTVADGGKNGSIATAQELTLPAAVDGACDGATFDHFKFSAKAGQRVAVEVVAARLGQSLDPVLRLLDTNGKQVAWADDDALLGSDCRLEYKVAADGVYVIELRDNQFRAGGRYRLRVGDFSVNAVTYPLPVMAVASADAGPAAMESEPNDELAKANTFAVPGSANGRFDSAKDKDCFQFDAKKNDRFTFRAISRSAGSPALVRMFVQKPDGAAVVESAVTEADEESLAFTAPADGRYVLRVEELLRRGGPEFAYRIQVERAAGFSLALKADKKGKLKYALAKNGAVAIDVPCVRAGYDGPITLGVESSAGPLLTFNNVIPEKAVTTKLIIVPPAEMPEGVFASVRIVGRATIDGREVTATLGTGDLMRTISPASYNMPAWVEGRLSLGLVPAAKPIFTTTLEPETVSLHPEKPTAEFTVALERTNAEFKDPLTLYFADAPAGFAFDVKREGNGPKETYKVTLKIPEKSPVGKHKVRIVSYGELKAVPQTTVAELAIEISTEEKK